TQRLILARALLHDPSILLFDEPFTGLDTPGERLLLETLDEERRAGKAIFLVTHDVRVAHAAATEGVVLAAARVRRRLRTSGSGDDSERARSRPRRSRRRTAKRWSRRDAPSRDRIDGRREGRLRDLVTLVSKDLRLLGKTGELVASLFVYSLLVVLILSLGFA